MRKKAKKILLNIKNITTLLNFPHLMGKETCVSQTLGISRISLVSKKTNRISAGYHLYHKSLS